MKLRTKIVAIIGALLLTSCDLFGGNKEDPILELFANDYTFVNTPLTLTSRYDGNLVEEVTYVIKGENSIEAAITADKISANLPGIVSVVAKYELASKKTTKTIESAAKSILFLDSEETIENRISSAGLTRLDLGKVISLGFEVFDDSVYSLTSDNDKVLKVLPNNTLEVVGLGRGNLLIKNEKTSKVLYDNPFVTYNSILATEIRNRLVASKKIDKFGDEIYQSHFDTIEELSIENNLANDPSISLGIKYLRNLKTLSLRNNGITDISFISDLTKLEHLNLASNKISNLKPLDKLKSLVTVDLSNNRIKDISTFLNHQYITSLNLAVNQIEDLSSLSTLFNLESLYLGQNKFNGLDDISGLYQLKKLDISYASITASDVFGLSYINTIEYLDISGINISTSNLPVMNLLTELHLNEVSGLGVMDLANLHKYPNLEALSIGGNNLNLTELEPFLTKIKTDETYKKLERLNIGGNKFITLPDLSMFENLSSLNLANSRNLSEVDSLSLLVSLEQLNIDNCRSLLLSYTLPESEPFSFIETIENMENLAALSMVGALHILTKDVFERLEVLANDKDRNFKMSIFEGEWIDETTIVNIKSSFFFSFEQLIEASSPDVASDTIILPYQNNQRKLVVNLTSYLGNSPTVFAIPKELFSLEIYGRKSINYSQISFKVEDRKESDFTFFFQDFNLQSSSGKPVIFDDPINEGTTEIIFSGTVKFSAPSSSAITGYNITIKPTKLADVNDTITITAGNGVKGDDGPSFNSGGKANRKGKAGTAGHIGIDARNHVILSHIVTVKGGNGGAGGKGGDSKTVIGFEANNPGDGGRGGDGGAAVRAKTLTKVGTQVSLNGGKGGSGGIGGRNTAGAIHESSSDGRKGNDGAEFIAL